MIREEVDKMLHSAKTIKEAIKALEAGADVNAKGEYERTPLYIATKHGYTDVVRLLIDNGANVNSADEYGSTPLMEAAWRGYTDIAELLIKKNAEVNHRDENERTPLYLAAWDGNADMVELLINNGADVNAKRSRGDGALYAAAKTGNANVVRLLIERGANTFDLSTSSDKEIQLIRGVKYSINYDKVAQNKRNIKERIISKKLKGISGVVVADKIAEHQISGQEKRIVTSQVGKNLRRKIMQDLNTRKFCSR